MGVWRRSCLPREEEERKGEREGRKEEGRGRGRERKRLISDMAAPSLNFVYCAREERRDKGGTDEGGKIKRFIVYLAFCLFVVIFLSSANLYKQSQSFKKIPG